MNHKEEEWTMTTPNVIQALREMLREQLCCVGRVAARHQLPDDAVWEIAKGFEVLYRRACRQVKATSGGSEGGPSVRRPEPHPGLTYLLTALDREDDDSGESGEALHAGTGVGQPHV
jgi:hypothetical protein